MRSQWCRQNIQKVIEECGLSQASGEALKNAAKFCEINPEFAKCPTSVITRILSIKDTNVRKGTLQEAKKTLRRKTPTGGFITDRFTEPEIRRIIAKHQLLVTGTTAPNVSKTHRAKPKKGQNVSKSRILTIDVLEKEDLNTIRSIITLDYAVDEYAAIKVAIKWAAERIAVGM